MGKSKAGNVKTHAGRLLCELIFGGGSKSFGNSCTLEVASLTNTSTPTQPVNGRKISLVYPFVKAEFGVVAKDAGTGVEGL